MFQRWLSVLAAAALVAGCNCKHTGNTGGGNGGLHNIDGLPQATPNPVDFGTVGTGTTHSKSFVLTNAGDGPLNILSTALTGDSSFTAPPQKGVLLQPGDTVTINVTFTPQIDGPHAASFTFTSDSTASPSYVVSLTGIAFSYKVEVSPIELDFGEVQVGTMSPAQTVTVTNNSSAAETITVGPTTGATDFQVSPTGAQANVAAGASFTVSVVYAPTTPGAEQAQLPISACNGCIPVNVALTGTGIDTQVLVVDNDTFQPFVAFGMVPQGMTVAANVIAQAMALPPTATTLLTATLTAAPVFEQTPPPSPGFTVTPTDSNFNPMPGGVAAVWPPSITPGAPASSIAYFIVTYTPPAGSNAANGIVDIAYTVGTDPTVRIAKLPVSAGLSSGQCQQVVATPNAVSFGTVLSGASSSKVVTLTNNGPQSCQLTGISINPNDVFNEFGIQGAPSTPLSLGPGQTQPVTVTFTPATGTPPLLRKADLSITTSDTMVPTITVPLSGTLQNVAYAPSAWPKWHHDNGNTGLSGADTSANNGTFLWKVPIGKPVGTSGSFASYIHSPAIGKDPASGDDIVYMLGYNNWVPSPKRGTPGSGFGLLYAIDGANASVAANSGTTIWSTQITGPEASAQEATPTIVADNSIFLMTGGEQSYYPQFYHVAANGSILWSGVQEIGGGTTQCTFAAGAGVDCATLVPDGGANDGFDTCPGFDNNGVLYLYDDDQPGCDSYNSTAAGQPTLQWSTAATSPINAANAGPHVESFSAALTDTSESVFSWGGMVLAYSQAGTQMWGIPLGGAMPMTVGWGTKTSTCENDSKGSPAIDGVDAVVAFGGYDPTCTNINGGIVGVNLASSNQDWGFQFPTAPPPAAPYNKIGYGSAIVAYSSPATIGDNGLVMGWLDGVYAFDPPATGLGAATQRWHATTGLVLSSPAVGADGTIFVGSTDGNLYAINNLTGAIKFKYTVGAAVNSSPAIGSDGTVYFAADDGNLYAVR